MGSPYGAARAAGAPGVPQANRGSAGPGPAPSSCATSVHLRTTDAVAPGAQGRLLVAAVLLKATGVTEDAAAADYLASFANAESMRALHGRSFDVEERRAVLGRFGHTADSAFRAMYRQLDLHDWLRHAGVDAATERAIVTWRAL